MKIGLNIRIKLVLLIFSVLWILAFLFLWSLLPFWGVLWFSIYLILWIRFTDTARLEVLWKYSKIAPHFRCHLITSPLFRWHPDFGPFKYWITLDHTSKFGYYLTVNSNGVCRGRMLLARQSIFCMQLGSLASSSLKII